MKKKLFKGIITSALFGCTLGTAATMLTACPPAVVEQESYSIKVNKPSGVEVGGVELQCHVALLVAGEHGLPQGGLHVAHAHLHLVEFALVDDGLLGGGIGQCVDRIIGNRFFF